MSRTALTGERVGHLCPGYARVLSVVARERKAVTTAEIEKKAGLCSDFTRQALRALEARALVSVTDRGGKTGRLLFWRARDAAHEVLRNRVLTIGRSTGLLARDAEPKWFDGFKWHDTPPASSKLSFTKYISHRELRDWVLARDGGACVACFNENELMIDHIISRRNGGSNHPDNLQVLCGGCNSRKSGLVDSKGRFAEMGPP